MNNPRQPAALRGSITGVLKMNPYTTIVGSLSQVTARLEELRNAGLITSIQIKRRGRQWICHAYR
jgi:CRISPR/Cas system-associated protein Cas5 (RAMP superfamily)